MIDITMDWNLSQKYFQMIVMRLRRDIKDQSKLDLMI